MPFDPTDPRYASPLAAMAQDRMTGMLNQPQMKVFASSPQDGGTNTRSPILPAQDQLNRTMGMAKGGQVTDDYSAIKDRMRSEFAKRGLDFDRFVQNPVVMDEVGKSIQAHGQSGDTILAHINPKEAQALKRMGGSGTINPHTGLPQFAEDSSSSNQSPSYGGGDYGGYTGGSDIGGYSGSGNTTYNPSTGGTDTSSDMGGYISGGGGDYRPSSSGGGTSSSGGGGGSQNNISPLGAGAGSVPMGTQQPQIDQTTGAVPSFAGIDPMSGLPIGGASNISGLGYLATAPDIAPSSAPAIGVDTNTSQPELSNINFSDMNVGMAPGATMPGGISNYGASPINPGYTDVGVTAMRMAANQPGGEGYRSQSTEYNLGKIGEFDPVAQTQAANILNQMMNKGYAPGFDPFGVGRTFEQQAALKAAAGNNLTAEPGKSFHNYGLAMDVENLSNQGYRDLSQIAAQEGWGWGGSQDPAHVQMAPWGAGAMQTAQNLGAEPFTGATRSIASAPQNTLQGALNTVSDIASELFGVKSAKAQEAPQQKDMLGDFYRQTEPFGGEEIMSPLGASGVPGMAFPPQSQQQMLDVLGIGGAPVPSGQAAQVLGSGVYPSYEQLGTLPPGQKYQGRAPIAPEIASVPSSPLSPASIFPVSTFGYPEQFPSYPRVAIADVSPGLLSFETPQMDVPAEQQNISEPLGPSANVMSFNPTDAIKDFREKLAAVPMFGGFSSLGSFGVNDPQNPNFVSDAKILEGITNSMAKQGEGTGIIPAFGGAIVPETSAAQQAAQQALRQQTVNLGEFNPDVAGKTITINPANWGIETTGIPTPTSRAETIGEAPTGFGVVAPQETGLSSFETALGGLPATAPKITTGITSPLSLGAETTPRVEVPSESTTRMTTEQLKEMGVYKEPLESNQTVRDNFNEAYADATKRGIEIFEWTNPATGAIGLYKSGSDDANIPAKNAKDSSGEKYDKRIAELEDAGMIANGMSKEEYAAEIGVPVDQVKTRVTTQFGAPMVEYYTKSIGEAMAGMTGGTTNTEGLLNLLSLTSPLGLFSIAGKNLYNQYKSNTSPLSASSTEQTTIPTPSSNGGGKDNRVSTGTKTSTRSTSTNLSPLGNLATQTPTNTGLLPVPERQFVGIPIDFTNYGYGGEYTYYSAKGGPVSPLKAMGKK